jgi:hypothetical protein
MRTIAELTGGELKWRQRGNFKMDYELMSDGEVAATLRWRSVSGSLATAESADGCWTFKRVGVWRVKVTVRRCGSETDLAAFRYDSTSGGVLTLHDGRRYPAYTTPRATSYDFRSDLGEPLIRLKSEGMMHHVGTVEILPAAGPALANVPWIVMLAWYLTVMTYIDEGASATG